MVFNPNNFRRQNDPILNITTEGDLSVKDRLQNIRNEHSNVLKGIREERDKMRKEGNDEEADGLQDKARTKQYILSKITRPEQNTETLDETVGIIYNYFNDLNSSIYSEDTNKFSKLLEEIPKDKIQLLLDSDYKNSSSNILFSIQRISETLERRGWLRMYHNKKKYNNFIQEVLVEGVKNDSKIYKDKNILMLLEDIPYDIDPVDKENIKVQIDKNIDKEKISALFFEGIQGKKSIEGLISIGSKVAIETITDITEQALDPNGDQEVKNTLSSLTYDYEEYRETTELITKIVGKRLEKEFNIKDGNTMVKRFKNKVSMGIESNLMSLRNIEKESPGGIKLLHENYGIYEFNRYPKEMMIDQINNHNKDIPYGVLFYPAEDSSDAFDQDKEVLKQLYDGTKGKHISRVFEVEGRLSLARYLVTLKLKYKSKIDFMILAGHGEESGMEFSWKSHLDKDLVNRSTSIDSIKEMMTDEPSIVLFSCSTGAEEGFAQTLSEKLNAKVQAPTVESGPQSLSVRYDGNKPTIDVKFRDEQSEYFKGILEKQNS